MVSRRDLDERSLEDQRPSGCQAGQIPHIGLPLQCLLAQDVGQLQARLCWEHDLLWISAVRQVGYSYRSCAVPQCVPTFSLASDEG